MCLDGRGSAGAVQQEVTVAGRWRPGPQGSLSFAPRKHILDLTLGQATLIVVVAGLLWRHGAVRAGLSALG